jgi:signal transduction histidine kinase
VTDPTSRLLRRTRRRLSVVTLSLIALLVIGIGAATAVITLEALDADVDRALAASVDATAKALHDGLPEASDSGDSEDSVPSNSDTFVLVLDPGGSVVSNPSRIALPGLPDQAALEAAALIGRDLRTVEAGGQEVRLLTVAIEPSETGGRVVGYAQGGFVLTLHDQQSQSIVAAILLVGGIGLIGAAVVTVIVTGRALVPIRRSFDVQRRFVADASHELRTPAALIRANADVVEREALVSPEGEPLVADIIAEADRLGRLVGDLLQLAAADATGIVLDSHPTDVAAMAADTVRQAAALAASRGVELVVDPDPAASALVNGDRDRLVQLLLILLDNAFDHSPRDGVVTVAVRRQAKSVELSVSDEGPGIPAAERERVFDPFTRLPGVRRDRAGGTGLGLAIGRRIAIAHGGTVRVDDAPGGGAMFIVALPATQGHPAR